MMTQLPSQKGVEPPPQFSAHVYSGQMAGWIKMALGTKMGLRAGHIVLDGDLAPLAKRGRSSRPNFRPISIVAKRLDASRCHFMQVGLGPGDFVFDGNPATPRERAHPVFGPCLLWPRSPISATAELLLTPNSTARIRIRIRHI